MIAWDCLKVRSSFCLNMWCALITYKHTAKAAWQWLSAWFHQAIVYVLALNRVFSPSLSLSCIFISFSSFCECARKVLRRIQYCFLIASAYVYLVMHREGGNVVSLSHSCERSMDALLLRARTHTNRSMSIYYYSLFLSFLLLFLFASSSSTINRLLPVCLARTLMHHW